MHINMVCTFIQECPPFLDFPLSLRSVVEGHTAILKGGLQIDGSSINEVGRHMNSQETIQTDELTRLMATN